MYFFKATYHVESDLLPLYAAIFTKFSRPDLSSSSAASVGYVALKEYGNHYMNEAERHADNQYLYGVKHMFRFKAVVKERACFF